MEFTPLSPVRSIDTGNYYSFNPHMVDDRGPHGSDRRIMHGWATIGKPPEIAGIPYWEHAHSVPRVLSIKDNRIWQEPIPELACLRYESRRLGRHVLSSDTSVPLPSLQGDALEIFATFNQGSSQRCGLVVRANDRGEGLKVWVGGDNTFGIEECRHTHCVSKDAQIELRIFVDRGVVETYCDGVALTHRCFASPDEISVLAFCEAGEATLTTVEAWKMKSIFGTLRLGSAGKIEGNF
jgi:beta-fructofuranosidase